MPKKINWNGQIEWDANGAPISIEDNDQSAISFDIDESGQTAFIAWEDYRNGTDYNVVGREINLDSGVMNQIDVFFYI
jgi:hypothetical protein